MLWTLRVIAEAKALPRRLVVVTDGGDGNWSVATICFYGLLLAKGVFEEVRFFFILILFQTPCVRV